MKKMFVGCIYLKNEKAVKGFADQSVISFDPVALANQYSDSDMDALIVFDLSDTMAEHLDALKTVSVICEQINIPVYGGGAIHNTDDFAAYLECGCKKAVLNLGKEEGYNLLSEAYATFGSERIIATIASEDSINMNRQKLEEQVSELILIDEHAIKNCLGASTLPNIVFLPEISLDKMLSIMEKTNVSGISGNIVNENAKNIAALKSICLERGIPVMIFEPPMKFAEFKLLSDGLLPVVVQDYLTGQVLMVAYMNEEAYLTTLRTGKMAYYSRSRKELWIKGLTSGHYQYLRSLSIDCDNDTLLAKVRQIGAACHTGNYSCFYRDIVQMEETEEVQTEDKTLAIFDSLKGADISEEDAKRLLGRHTTELLLMANKDGKTGEDTARLKHELAGCMDNLFRLMSANGISPDEVYQLILSHKNSTND